MIIFLLYGTFCYFVGASIYYKWYRITSFEKWLAQERIKDLMGIIQIHEAHICHLKEVKHMSKTNLVKLASTIAKKEGLKKQVSIGNVREIMKLLFKELKTMTLQDIVVILKKY